MTPHNPWRYLADHHPDVSVIWGRLTGGVRGYTDGATIWMNDRLTQVQRRITVCHETIHIERGIIPADPAEESRVERLTAERLITTSQLVDALRWHRHGTDIVLADHLWVDAATVRCRLDTMTPDERTEIAAALRNAA